MIKYFKVKHCKHFPGLKTTDSKWSDISWFPGAWELSAFTTLYMPTVKTENKHGPNAYKGLEQKIMCEAKRIRNSCNQLMSPQEKESDRIY